jgi:hypothetical protein
MNVIVRGADNQVDLIGKYHKTIKFQLAFFDQVDQRFNENIAVFPDT